MYCFTSTTPDLGKVVQNYRETSTIPSYRVRPWPKTNETNSSGKNRLINETKFNQAHSKERRNANVSSGSLASLQFTELLTCCSIVKRVTFGGL